MGQAGIDLEGCDQIKLIPIKVLLVHNDVECLLEAAYHVMIEKKANLISKKCKTSCYNKECNENSRK